MPKSADPNRMSSVIMKFQEVTHLQDGHVVFLEANNWASKDVTVRGGRAVFENEEISRDIFLKKKTFSDYFRPQYGYVRLYEKASGALTKTRVIAQTRFDLAQHSNVQGQRVERYLSKTRKVRSRGDTALNRGIQPVLFATITGTYIATQRLAPPITQQQPQQAPSPLVAGTAVSAVPLVIHIPEQQVLLGPSQVGAPQPEPVKEPYKPPLRQPEGPKEPVMTEKFLGGAIRAADRGEGVAI